MTRPRCLRIWVALLALGLAGTDAGAARAQDGGDGSDRPQISLDRDVVAPGDVVRVALTGWAGSEVTLSVCGNRAARGSMDCNLVASDGVPLNRDGSPTLADFRLSSPALSCPCVIRASSTRNEDLVVAPIELVGHPVGPVVEPTTTTPLRVTVLARRASAGWVAALRSTLGGPTRYDVTVSVTNRTTGTLSGILVAATAERSWNDVETDLAMPAVGRLEPGQTWEHTAHPVLPAPALGGVVFQVAASGAGPSVEVVQSTTTLPIGLVLMTVVLVVDLVAILWRRVTIRRRSRREPEGLEVTGTGASAVSSRAQVGT